MQQASMGRRSERVAIVIFNLGGPDGPAAVRPFLFNLFNDPNILLMPAPARWFVARMISTLRAPKSRKIYQQIGGRSVLLEETQAQATALETATAWLADSVRVFTFMRYWHPMADDVVADVKAYNPTRIVMLPLYPQFSTTTTGTSVAAFAREAARQGLTAPVHTVCCYPTDEGFVGAVAGMVQDAHGRMRDAAPVGQKAPRVIFCAHSLPEKTIASGDPYQAQVERTAAAIAQRTGIGGLDWTLCYQSRLGPVKWIGPSIVQEIRRAGADGVPVIVVPVAFVSEHVETLVELDRDMRDLAGEVGVPVFHRVPAVRTHAAYIDSLVRLAAGALRRGAGMDSAVGGKLCEGRHGRCPHKGQSAAQTVESCEKARTVAA